MSAQKVNLQEAVEIAPGVYWVGFYDPNSLLPCNPYLLVDGEEAVLIDPGSVPHFPIVATKVVSTVKPAQVSTMIVQHQDPDLCGALPVLEELIGTDRLRIAAHSTAIYLITYYGIRSPLYAVDQNEFQLTFGAGRRLRFIHLPNLHAPGAIATYDEQTRTLFSGDLFGGLATEWTLYARAKAKEGMCDFHRRLMPCQELLRRGLERLKGLEIDLIAPQHGSIITKGQIADYFDTLWNLKCGWDLEAGGK